MFLGEGPPPLEALSHAQLELSALLLGLHLSDEGNNVGQRLGRPPVVRHAGDLTAELQHGDLLSFRETDLVQDLHPLGFTQNVVIQSALGDPVPGAGLGEPQLLGDDRLDGVL